LGCGGGVQAEIVRIMKAEQRGFGVFSPELATELPKEAIC
jgi:hypothetical protein